MVPDEVKFSYNFAERRDLERELQNKEDEVARVSANLQQKWSAHDKLGEECDRALKAEQWETVISKGNDIRKVQISITKLTEMLDGHVESRKDAKQNLADHESLLRVQCSSIVEMQKSFEQKRQEFESFVESENCQKLNT